MQGNEMIQGSTWSTIVTLSKGVSFRMWRADAFLESMYNEAVKKRKTVRLP